MDSLVFTPHDVLQQKLGESQQRIVQLEAQLRVCRTEWEPAAREWQRFQRHQSDLAEWLVESATDAAGRVVIPQVDAALGGETCIPGDFFFSVKGCRYHLKLVSTDYKIEEV